ncbi:LamG domain-containing protein [bacterium]|nr:LamG domain-containing protein [bacterium]
MRLLNSIRPKVCLLAMTLTSVILLLTAIAFSADDKLVLYYKFDKIAKDKVIDHSGTGNDGTIVGNVKEANGKIDGGLIFGGQSDYVDVPDSESLDLTEVYTAAVWVNFTEITGQRHQFFFDKGADDKAPGGWRLGKVMSGEIVWQIFKDGAWQPRLDAPNPALQEEKWYHAAVTRDSSGESKIYLDGKMMISSQLDAFVLPESDNTLTVGGSAKWVPSNMFIGALDELLIYNGKALSEHEIQNVMDGLGASVNSSGKAAITWGEIKS